MLKRDKRWEIFYGDISLEQFVKEKIPAPIFKKAVNTEVANSFVIVWELLVHSYYEYLFVDVAITRALHIFEMALYLRYKELHNGTEWDLKKKSLSKLIDWFNDRQYFEIANKDFLNHVRGMRNQMTHLKGFHFVGSIGLPWINTVVDLINGLYEDIELRKERWKNTGEIKAKLNSFFINGAKLIILDKVYYIYNFGPLKIENRLEPAKCYLSLLPVFEIDKTTQKLPLLVAYPSSILDFSTSSIDFSFGTERIKLSNDLTANESDMIAKFRAKIQNEEEYRVQNSMLLFDADNTILKAVRESLEHNIVIEQEFEIVIKHHLTLETSRNRTPSLPATPGVTD